MWKKTIMMGIGATVLSVGYYAFSPVFKTVTVNDEFPTSQITATKYTTRGEVPPEEKTFPVIGTSGHPAGGSVRIINTGAGKVIRYENFKTLNGPDLFIYLSKDLKAKEFISLGEIKGTEGNINYAIPDGVRIDEYSYVMTWCRQFGVLFNYVNIAGSNIN